MAATFRKGKIEDYAGKLQIRIDILKKQLIQEEFKSQKDLILGEIKATELILEELKNEFGITIPVEEG